MSNTICTIDDPNAKPAGKIVAAVGKVTLNGKECWGKFDSGQWFFSLDPETAGWTAASPDLAKRLEESIGRPKPQERSEEPGTKAMPKVVAKPELGSQPQPSAAEKPHEPPEADANAYGDTEVNADLAEAISPSKPVQCRADSSTGKVAAPRQHLSVERTGPPVALGQPIAATVSVDSAYGVRSAAAAAGTVPDAREPDSPNEWEDLIPLAQEFVPAFPVDDLPPVLREWVAATAEATQTPPDMAALLSMAVCAAAVAKRVEVQPHPDWSEPVNIFAAVILDPANRKSSVFRAATKPLSDLEAELWEQQGPAIAREMSERQQAEKRLASLEKTAAQCIDAVKAAKAKTEAGDLAEELQGWPEPSLPRLITDDCTTEKLAVLLSQQGERTACLSAEGGVFDLMAGRYTAGASDLTVFLKGHAGDMLRVERIGRASVIVQNPALTLGLAMQPGVLRGLADKPSFRERGLLARFWFSVPESLIGCRQTVPPPPPVPEPVREAYAATVKALASIPPADDGEARKLMLAPDASAVFGHWQQEVELQLADGGQLELMRDWGGKLCGLTLRLAGIMHCVMNGGPEPWKAQIDAETMRAAIEIGRYSVAHARAALRLLHASKSTVSDDAQYLLRWIKKEGLCEFTRRDAQGHGRRRFDGEPERLDAALKDLEQTNHIRQPSHTVRGVGRPSILYVVNPRVFDTATRRIGSPRESPEQEPAPSFVDSAHTDGADAPVYEEVTL